MEFFLLQVVAFLRPILFVEIGMSNIFDIGGIGIILILITAIMIRGATGQVLAFNLIDALIAAFVTWAIVCTIIYPETMDIRSLAKLTTPFVCYTVAKNVLRDRAQYMRLLFLMILGYVLPVIISAGLIMMGKGAEKYGADYWTGLLRWEGIYDGAHNMGHNMTFLLMLLVLYISFREFKGNGAENALATPTPSGNSLSMPAMMALIALALPALYCLWMSQVRTALLGLMVFTGVYLFYRNRRLLVIGTGAIAVIAIVMFPIIKPYLFPDIVMIEKTGGDAELIGSGRPIFWKDNLSLFADLPIDRQLAGVGIGRHRLPGFMDSHNDILDLLIQTGIVGLGIYLVLQVAILKRLLQLHGMEKHVFVALFTAVLVMNLVSNSYVARFGMAQMYYLVIAFVDIRLSTSADWDLKKSNSVYPAG